MSLKLENITQTCRARRMYSAKIHGFIWGLLTLTWVIRKFLLPINSIFSPNKCYEHSKSFFVFSAKITHRSYYIITYYCIQHRTDRQPTSTPKHRTNRWKRYRCWLVFGSCPVRNTAGSQTTLTDDFRGSYQFRQPNAALWPSTR